jgi:hypothetical protein
MDAYLVWMIIVDPYTTIMKEPSETLHVKQTHGRRLTDIFGVWEWIDGS